MKIGIDANEANVHYKMGVHQYAYEILWSIYKINNKSKNPDKFTLYLKDSPNTDLPPKNKFWHYKILPGKKLWILTRLMPYLLLQREVDCLFVPSHYVPPLTKVPIVCTIHDVGYLNFSGQFKRYDFYQLKYWTAISLKVSKQIIAVSKFTKSDIVRHYNIASQKIHAIPHGFDQSRFNHRIAQKNVRRALKKYNIDSEYILFLSTLKPSKNIEGILSAYKLLLEDRKLSKYKLVIAGKKGWLYDSIFKKVKELDLQKKVIFTGYVEEKDKPSLLFGAKLLVSPSFWEGFGIHVLEAMACGTPVVVSRVASLPEVVGKAGLYVDAKNSKDIAGGMKKILTMKSADYDKIVNKSLKQASKFSWEKTGKRTLEIIKSV